MRAALRTIQKLLLMDNDTALSELAPTTSMQSAFKDENSEFKLFFLQELHYCVGICFKQLHRHDRFEYASGAHTQEGPFPSS